MIRRFNVLLLAFTIVASGCTLDVPRYAPETSTILIVTDAGEIEIELAMAAAPITVANFLTYANNGAYVGGGFSRAIHYPLDDGRMQGFVIADINPQMKNPEEQRPIALESTDQTGITHTDGTISMARHTVTGATTQFFICIGDRPEFDFGGSAHSDGQGFAAFGRVTRGMEVVRAIHAAGGANGELIPPVRIHGIRRLGNQ